jgi:hypothetical protein
MKKFRTKSLFFLMMLFAAMLSVCVAASETLYVCTERDDLNARRLPTISSRIEMRLPPGEEVLAVSFKDGWVEVVGGESGTSWCKAEYLSSTLEPAFFTNTSGGRVFLRDAIEGKRKGVVRANKTILVTRQIFGWGYTGNGWVDLSFFDEVPVDE